MPPAPRPRPHFHPNQQPRPYHPPCHCLRRLPCQRQYHHAHYRQRRQRHQHPPRLIPTQPCGTLHLSQPFPVVCCQGTLCTNSWVVGSSFFLLSPACYALQTESVTGWGQEMENRPARMLVPCSSRCSAHCLLPVSTHNGCGSAHRRSQAALCVVNLSVQTAYVPSVLRSPKKDRGVRQEFGRRRNKAPAFSPHAACGRFWPCRQAAWVGENTDMWAWAPGAPGARRRAH